MALSGSSRKGDDGTMPAGRSGLCCAWSQKVHTEVVGRGIEAARGQSNEDMGIVRSFPCPEFLCPTVDGGRQPECPRIGTPRDVDRISDNQKRKKGLTGD